jgi:hypothetical protein
MIVLVVVPIVLLVAVHTGGSQTGQTPRIVVGSPAGHLLDRPDLAGRTPPDE